MFFVPEALIHYYVNPLIITLCAPGFIPIDPGVFSITLFIILLELFE